MTVYKKRTSDLKSTIEVGFQDYKVETISIDNSAFQGTTMDVSGFHAEHIRLLNDSEFDALIKINSKDAFTLPGGDILSIGFDDVSQVEVKSKTADTTIVEVMILGRLDLNA